MAPSPELGQPKAPDKTDTSTTGSAKNEDKTDSGDKHESIKETDFSSTATTTTTTTSSTTTKQQDSENLSNLDERALEALLKEAITYKTPRDREHKSEMFRELLQDAEKENQKSDFSSYDLRYRKHKGSNRHTQGGSLQDLAETDNLDDIFGHNKKHYNLKQRHSSVSSRQREGGSLPSNVNVPLHNLMSFDTSCMFDVNLNKKKCKASGLHNIKQQNSKDESQLYHDSKIVGDTVIEIGDDESDDNQTNIPYEPLQEELSEPINPTVDYTDVNSSICHKLPRIQPQRQYTSQAKIEISETSPPRLINQSTDKTVSFSLLENSSNKNNVDMTPVQLNPSYNSVESIVGNKTELNPRATILPNKFISANIFPQKLDVGDNSVQPFNASLPTSSQPNKLKYKKVPKSDRNTITVDYTKKEGFRGTDTIKDLVRYIEENETEKRRKEHNSNNSNNNGSCNNNSNNNNNNPSNNHNNNGAVLNSNNSNKKTKNNNSKKESSKLKKCNSLEELSSCSKLKELKESSNIIINNNNSSSTTATTPSSSASSTSSSSSSASSTTSSTASQNQNEAVTLRTKSNNKNKNNSDPNHANNNNNVNNNNKKLVLIKTRIDRRSWGTEELSYLGDSKVNSDYIKNNSNDINKDEDIELSLLNINNTNNNISNSNNNINIISSIESSELISSQVNSIESSEFLLVTKKKKPKKKLENNNNNNIHNNNKNSGNNHNNRGNNINRSKYNNNNNNLHHHHNSHNIHNTNSSSNNQNHQNDRDLYLNSFNSSDNNRRKSTSSVPPSERSDSSDLDSVHSLPVESIKSSSYTSPPTSNLYNNNNNTSAPTTQSRKMPASSNQISYADIAKIPNKTTTTTNNNNNNNDIINNHDTTITISTTINTATITNNTATTPTVTDNLINKQLLYSKSLNEIKTATNQPPMHHQQPQQHHQPNGIIVHSQFHHQAKNQLHLTKSKSVDNDNYNVSIDHYPALEKTIKKSSQNSNQINNIYVNSIIQNDSNRMTKTSKKSNTTTSPPSVTPNATFTTTTISTPKKILVEPIEVSQIEKSIRDELYNTHKQQPPVPVLNKVALKQVVVNNNNNINIHKLNEFAQCASTPIIVAPLLVTNDLIPIYVPPPTATIPIVVAPASSSSTSMTTTPSIGVINSSTIQSSVAAKRPTKKDKSNSTTSQNSNVVIKNTINSNSSNANSNRPAVIILNDNSMDSKTGNDITFGFEINQNLLFGDFNEDEMKLFETTPAQSQQQQQTTINNSNVPNTINNNNLDVSDYFSISDTSLELSGSATAIPTTVATVIPSTNQMDTNDNQCDSNNIMNDEDVDKLNNNNNNNNRNDNEVVIDNNNYNNNSNLDKNENLKKICENDITKINYKAPNLNDIILAEHNHDKIVNFIESAWEDIISGTNGGAQYYNGQ